MEKQKGDDAYVRGKNWLAGSVCVPEIKKEELNRVVIDRRGIRKRKEIILAGQCVTVRGCYCRLTLQGKRRTTIATGVTLVVR